MATDAKIWVAGTDQYLEGVAVTTPAGADLFREGVVISDPDTAAARAAVKNAAPGAADYGVLIRVAGPVDAVSGAVQVIQWEHSRIHSGRGYTWSEKASVNNGATLYHLMDNGAANYPHLRLVLMQATSAPFDVALYESPTIAANGTPNAVQNNNRNSANVSGLAIYDSPTVTSDGTLLEYLLIAGTKQSGGSGDSGVETEWVLKPSTKYLLKMTNNSGGVATIGCRMFWYEGGA